MLRYRIGGAEVMAGQLGYLLEAIALPSVSLGVIPFGGSPTGPRGRWSSSPSSMTRGSMSSCCPPR